ncbi:MAG TPA: hypothetical protein DER60_04560 [Syntrophomonas sp.]|jgi:hypothetical protein|nr:hypothetical protein [Syntrophomonas sp.]
MMVIAGVLLSIIGMITVFFNIPYSKTRAEFAQITGRLSTEITSENGVFTEAEIAALPGSVQKYFRYCGYIGTPKMSYMKATYQDVAFSFGRDKPTVIMDYTQYNFVGEPSRIAYIDSSMYGIPFEGLDSYIAGNGSMRGVLAKLFTLFDQSGDAMDKAGLVTFLSECLIMPDAALQDYVAWEEIDDLHAKATISFNGITASGIFTFKENGEMHSFTTDDREAISTDGSREKVKWSAVCSEYLETNGIKKPTVSQAIWHYDDGDLVYFDAKDLVVELGTSSKYVF